MNIRPDLQMIEIVSATLSEMLGEEFDAETFWDTLDGETDVLDVIGHLIRQRIETDAFAEASKAVASDYVARARRLSERSTAINRALGEVLDATGQRKVMHPLATVSRTSGRLSCQITDEATIPSQLTVTTVKPDTAAIKKQLEAGESVPGAELVRGPDGVTVRVK